MSPKEAKKKCPICGKPYRDYITHIWTHKAKTVKYLQERRRSSKGKSRTKSTSSQKSIKAEIEALLRKHGII